MAVGDYCDYSDYVVRYVDLTSDVDTLVDFADNVKSTGGGDAPEVCYDFFISFLYFDRFVINCVKLAIDFSEIFRRFV